mmetsp:Transcript_21979/g.39198  ORF Transcript_21979/g.39198 Transcript_21979/m.39198 type:complete len:264 (+) Transcript_21979:40-831(+)
MKVTESKETTERVDKTSWKRGEEGSVGVLGGDTFTSTNDEERDPSSHIDDSEAAYHQTIVALCNTICQDILSTDSSLSPSTCGPSSVSLTDTKYQQQVQQQQRQRGDSVPNGESRDLPMSLEQEISIMPSHSRDENNVRSIRASSLPLEPEEQEQQYRDQTTIFALEKQNELLKRRSKLQGILDSMHKFDAYEKSQGLMDNYSVQVEVETLEEDVQFMKEKYETLCEALFQLHLQRLDLMHLQEELGDEQTSSDGSIGDAPCI